MFNGKYYYTMIKWFDGMNSDLLNLRNVLRQTFPLGITLLK